MRTYVADFETTVYEGQTDTEVWASALVDIEATDDYENVIILHSLPDTLNYLNSQQENATLYYHNLKFDEQFWLYYLIEVLHFNQGIDYISPTEVIMKKPKDLLFLKKKEFI